MPCSSGATCKNGDCFGGVLQECADFDNECNKGECIDDVCVAVPVEKGLDCDDNDACTEGDTCSGGVCTGDTKDCDDDATCTTDSCDDTGTCVNEPIAGSCADDKVCTNEMCNPEHMAADDTTGCVITDNTAECPDFDSDDDVCTTGECSNGECVSTIPNDKIGGCACDGKISTLEFELLTNMETLLMTWKGHRVVVDCVGGANAGERVFVDCTAGCHDLVDLDECPTPHCMVAGGKCVANCGALNVVGECKTVPGCDLDTQGKKCVAVPLVEPGFDGDVGCIASGVCAKQEKISYIGNQVVVAVDEGLPGEHSFNIHTSCSECLRINECFGVADGNMASIRVTNIDQTAGVSACCIPDCDGGDASACAAMVGCVFDDGQCIADDGSCDDSSGIHLDEQDTSYQFCSNPELSELAEVINGHLGFLGVIDWIEFGTEVSTVQMLQGKSDNSDSSDSNSGNSKSKTSNSNSYINRGL